MPRLQKKTNTNAIFHLKKLLLRKCYFLKKNNSRVQTRANWTSAGIIFFYNEVSNLNNYLLFKN